MHVRVLALAFVTALAGCSAQSVTSSICGGPPPTGNPAVPQLLYPVPSISNVPVSAQELVVAYSLSAATAFPLTLTPHGGSAIQLTGMKAPPKPLPAPIAAELVPGTPMYGVALPTLQGHTNYAVGYRYTVNYCSRKFVYNYTMGGFTTE
jgi:hypothetical protein